MNGLNMDQDFLHYYIKLSELFVKTSFVIEKENCNALFCAHLRTVMCQQNLCEYSLSGLYLDLNMMVYHCLLFFFCLFVFFCVLLVFFFFFFLGIPQLVRLVSEMPAVKFNTCENLHYIFSAITKREKLLALISASNSRMVLLECHRGRFHSN